MNKEYLRQFFTNTCIRGSAATENAFKNALNLGWFKYNRTSFCFNYVLFLVKLYLTLMGVSIGKAKDSGVSKYSWNLWKRRKSPKSQCFVWFVLKRVLEKPLLITIVLFIYASVILKLSYVRLVLSYDEKSLLLLWNQMILFQLPVGPDPLKTLLIIRFIGQSNA